MATRPGFHPDTDFSQYPRSLTKFIRTIAKSFYVTRSFNSERIGNSEYWALLARPSDDFSIHLNADRELLFLFSTYPTFEIRTLEAYDEFYALLEQKRVDKSIRFLISCDPRIEHIIQHYLNQHPEYPIIIPAFLDVKKGDSHDLLDAVRRNYLLRDLFGYQNPLREETFFFGRQDVVSTVLDLAKSGQSSSLFGLRKSGKTSTIYAIQRKARSFQCSPILVDCQNPAIHARRYGELLSYILESVRKAIGHKKRVSSLGEGPVEIAETFQNEMKNIVNQAKSNILIIFDEIENISPQTAASPHWDSESDAVLFWQTIRSFIQEEKKGKVSLCLVGTSPMLLEKAEINNIPNPMYLFSQKRFIPSFTFSETKEMIQKLGFFMGLEFRPEQIAKLQELYGGHPFFIRQVCSNLHQMVATDRPISVSDNDVQRAVERFGGQLEGYLQDILGNLQRFYPEEFELLGAIISGDSEEINEYGRDAPELIDHLIGYGIVEKRNESIEVRFEAIKQILHAMFQKETKETRWAEISHRRNLLEIEIRKELFFVSKRLDANTWQEIIQTSLSRKRYEQLSSIEPRVLFSRSSSPLYFSDLLALMKSESLFDYGQNRRRDLIRSMDLVNRLRKDSHANEVSEKEMKEVRDAFEMLEVEFLPPL